MTHPIPPQPARRVQLFGVLRAKNHHRPAAIPAGRAGALLAYLILHPATPHTRDRLANLLWPNDAPARVRRKLSDVLSRLRQALGANWLLVEGERIALRVDDDLWVDVWAFERLLQSDNPADLEQAASLYSDDLLPEIYDDWILPRRISLREQYFNLLLQLGELAEAADRPETAYNHFRRLSQADPMREEAHQGAMRNLTRLGRRAETRGDYVTAIDFYSRALVAGRAADNAWGIAVSLGNLGSAYRLKGNSQAALTYYSEALQVNRTLGRRRGEGNVHHGRGLALLDAGELARARRALETAHAIRVELGERDDLIETEAGLALVCLAQKRLAPAQNYLQSALDALGPGQDRPTLRQWVHYAAYRVQQAREQFKAARGHLLQAREAMLAAADRLDPADRDRFLKNVPLNQMTQAALDDSSQRIQIQLVRANVPLGRKLTDDDYISATWTIHAPEDDLPQNKGERRRQVLKRLLTEARSQGAVPTDDDLAAALDVSRRTILRDMETLAQAGFPLITRKRAGKAEPTRRR